MLSIAKLLVVAPFLGFSLTTALPPKTPDFDRLERRDLQSFISNLADGVTLDDIKESILPDFLNWNSSAEDGANKLGLSSNALNKLPLEFLNIPYVHQHQFSGKQSS